MEGYVYITGVGTDPDAGKPLEDPSMFRDPPSLGACMPNIRRFVSTGDWIFVVSGKTSRVDQYVIGGMRVADKISATEAWQRLPANRLVRSDGGEIRGNLIVDETGKQHALDEHPATEFAKRLSDFVIGDDRIVLQTPAEVAIGRAETAGFLSDLVGTPGERPIDIIGRMKRLDDVRVGQMIDWLRDVKRRAA